MSGPRASDRRDFSLNVYVGDEVLSRYGETIYPRRLFANGNTNDELALRVWVDDPDWTPQAHGMIRVPRSRGEHSDWVMPTTSGHTP